MRSAVPLPVVLFLLAIVFDLRFAIGSLNLSAMRLVLLVLIVPLTVRLLLGRYGRLVVTDILFFLHLAWTAVALAVNSPSQVVTQIGSTGVEFLGGYVLARAYIRDAASFLALCRFLILIVLCVLPFALYEAFTGQPPIIEAVWALPFGDGPTVVELEERMGLSRVQGFFSHPIHFGLFCSVVFSLAFVALKGGISDVRRFLTGAATAFAGFLSLSSGALLAIMMQFALITWAAAFRRNRSRWWLLLGLLAVIYVVVDLLSNRSPIRVFMSYATFSAHNAFWREIIFDWGSASVRAHPVFGIGLKDWVRPAFMRSASVDNFWLLMAMRYGLPGLLFLLAGCGWSLFRIIRRNFETDPVLAQIRLAWVFTFIGLTFTLGTVHIWGPIYAFTFFMFGAGIWLITVPPQTADTPTVEKPSAEARETRYTRFPAGSSAPTRMALRRQTALSPARRPGNGPRKGNP